MNQKSLSKWLKMMIIGVGICGLIICAIVLPSLAKALAPQLGNEMVCWVWVGLLWLTSAPCFIALVFSWNIMDNIGKDETFTRVNAELLKKISTLAAGDAVFLFVWNIVLFFLNVNHPSTLLVCLFVDFLGVVIAVIFAALSHLVYKAAELQEQSDLTI